MKTLNEWTKADLLNLPLALPEYSEKHYTSVLVLGRDDLNESGEQIIAIIGVNHGQPVEIAAGWVEFLDWIFPSPSYQDAIHPTVAGVSGQLALPGQVHCMSGCGKRK